MRSRRITIMFLVAFCLGAAPAGLWAYGGGVGTPEDPYLIYTAEEMNSIGLNQEDWDKHFRLMADIDLSAHTGSQVNLIGLYRAAQDPNDDLEVPFSGVFDGQGHAIANFTYEVAGDEDPADGWARGIGLFRLIDGADAEIRDLTLLDPNLHPSPACIQRVGTVGALAGVVKSGLITRCHIEGGTIQADSGAGGLVGWASRQYVDGVPATPPTISHCSTNCEVAHAAERPFIEAEQADRSLYRYYGGLLSSNGGVISDCNAAGPVLGGRFVGGLVGGNSGEIVHCHATGPVSGASEAGGLVGESYYGTISSSWAGGDVAGPNDVGLEETFPDVCFLGGLAGSCSFATTSDCYATGNVTGDTHVGGLAGACTDSTIQRCYASGAVSATNQQAGGLVGVAGLDTVISECHASASVSVPWMGGGLVGLNGGTIRTSWADGQVSGTSGIGGLVGEHKRWVELFAGYPLEYNGVIMDCYALTDVICEGVQGGGLVGSNEGGTVLRCFAAGQVLGFEAVGGLVGHEDEDYASEVAQSFWDMEATGLSLSANGVGLATDRMQQRTTYTEAGWDLADETANGSDDIWWILEGQDYPRLWWELTEEEPGQ